MYTIMRDAGEPTCGLNCMYASHYLFYRMFLGPFVGGVLVYKVGFQSMAAVRHT